MPKISALPSVATPTYADQIPVVQNGVTSQFTTLALMNGAINAKWYGAKGDGSDDTAALNAALAAGYLLNKPVYVPAGTYRYTESSPGSGRALLNRGVSFFGEGTMKTTFAPLSSMPNTADFMRIVPDANSDIGFLRIADFFLYSNIDGTVRGNRGIFLDATMTTNISKMHVYGLRISYQNGPAFEILNDMPTNQQGVPAFSKFEDNIFYDQLKLQGLGDSTVICNNFFNTPDASAREGIYLFHIDVGPGLGTSSHTMIFGNAVDCDGGFVKAVRGKNIKIFNNNIEMSHGPGSNGAMIDLDGSGGTMALCEVRSNLIAPFGTSTATSIIRVHAVKGCIIEDNTIASGNAVTDCIKITASASETVVGKNAILTTMFTNIVNDAGIGTCGVKKPITFTAAGVAATGAGYQVPSYFKTKENIVFLTGAFSGAAIATNTILTTLPADYRPSDTVRFAVNGTVGGAISSAVIEINNLGEVKWISEGGANATFGSLDGVSYPTAGVHYHSTL